MEVQAALGGSQQDSCGTLAGRLSAWNCMPATGRPGLVASRPETVWGEGRFICLQPHSHHMGPCLNLSGRASIATCNSKPNRTHLKGLLFSAFRLLQYCPSEVSLVLLVLRGSRAKTALSSWRQCPESQDRETVGLRPNKQTPASKASTLP